MSSFEDARRILDEAKANEQKAEENCATILTELELNGFRTSIEQIKNDERHHQQLVQQLIEFLMLEEERVETAGKGGIAQ